MAQGQSQLLMGDCEGPAANIRPIVAQMSIPLIQGTLRYAEICARTGTRAPAYPSKAAAEGTAFAAAIVPRLVGCPASKGPTDETKTGSEDAEFIWTQMKHGSTSYNFPAIKAAFERHYACLNVTCAEIGGFYDQARGMYNENAEPCIDPPPAGALLPNEGIVGIIIACIVALCLCLSACMCIWRLVRAEKKGKPVFTPLTKDLRPTNPA